MTRFFGHVPTVYLLAAVRLIKCIPPKLKKFRLVLGFLKNVYLTENCKKYTGSGRSSLKVTGNTGIVGFRINMTATEVGCCGYVYLEFRTIRVGFFFL